VAFGCRPYGKRRYVSLAELALVGAAPGSLGDLCRATSGEGETEPKQIGEGARGSTQPRDPTET